MSFKSCWAENFKFVKKSKQERIWCFWRQRTRGKENSIKLMWRAHQKRKEITSRENWTQSFKKSPRINHQKNPISHCLFFFTLVKVLMYYACAPFKNYLQSLNTLFWAKHSFISQLINCQELQNCQSAETLQAYYMYITCFGPFFQVNNIVLVDECWRYKGSV